MEAMKCQSVVVASSPVPMWRCDHLLEGCGANVGGMRTIGPSQFPDQKDEVGGGNLAILPLDKQGGNEVPICGCGKLGWSAVEM